MLDGVGKVSNNITTGGWRDDRGSAGSGESMLILSRVMVGRLQLGDVTLTFFEGFEIQG